MKGVFYGVSTGPGDPELMTVKAIRIIERCKVIAAPRTSGGRMLAYSIAAQAADMTGKPVSLCFIILSALCLKHNLRYNDG